MAKILEKSKKFLVKIWQNCNNILLKLMEILSKYEGYSIKDIL